MSVAGCLRSSPRGDTGDQRATVINRTSGIEFGPIDYIKYAEAFGATGLLIDTPDNVVPVMKKAFAVAGPVIVGVHVDYSDNHRLFEMIKGDSIH